MHFSRLPQECTAMTTLHFKCTHVNAKYCHTTIKKKEVSTLATKKQTDLQNNIPQVVLSVGQLSHLSGIEAPSLEQVDPLKHIQSPVLCSEKVVPSSVDHVEEMSELVYEESVEVSICEGIAANVRDTVGLPVLVHGGDIEHQLRARKQERRAEKIRIADGQ